jgi:hypothetical protein
MTAYCDLLDVKQLMTGDVPVSSDAWDLTITNAIGQVSDLIDQEVRNMRGQPEGWSFLPGTDTASRYTGQGSPLLPIDDSVAVSGVSLLDDIGNSVQTLTLGRDYQPWPINDLPITGLRRISSRWPTNYAGVLVRRTPGYAMTTPPNVALATAQEVIRAIRGGQAGEDDRLGMSPFGSVIVSKALLQSTLRMLNRYRFAAGLLRGPR